MAKLNARQQRFVEEYLIDLNATQAAIRAGYRERSADVHASRLLGIDKVRDAVAKAMAGRSKKTEITQERVLLELARIAFGDNRKLMTWGPGGVVLKSSDDLSEDDAALVSEVSETVTEKGSNIKIKTNDKMKAIELLGRHLGMFREKLEVTGGDGGPIQYKNLTDEEKQQRITELLAKRAQSGYV